MKEEEGPRDFRVQLGEVQPGATLFFYAQPREFLAPSRNGQAAGPGQGVRREL